MFGIFWQHRLLLSKRALDRKLKIELVGELKNNMLKWLSTPINFLNYILLTSNQFLKNQTTPK